MQNRRHRFFGHIERMDKSCWVSRCRTVEIPGSVGNGKANENMGGSDKDGFERRRYK